MPAISTTARAWCSTRVRTSRPHKGGSEAWLAEPVDSDSVSTAAASPPSPFGLRRSVATAYGRLHSLRERRLERAKGIEPSSVAWEATALPLSYARASASLACEIADRKGAVPPIRHGRAFP